MQMCPTIQSRVRYGAFERNLNYIHLSIEQLNLAVFVQKKSNTHWRNFQKCWPKRENKSNYFICMPSFCKIAILKYAYNIFMDLQKFITVRFRSEIGDV